jgi:hypothetical protein
MKYGSITTGIIADGLVLNIDAANRASTIPSTSTTTTFNTVDLSQSGSFTADAQFDSSTISPSFDFDGTGDLINLNFIPQTDLSINFTLLSWANIPALSNNGYGTIIGTYDFTSPRARFFQRIERKSSGDDYVHFVGFGTEQISAAANPTIISNFSVNTWVNLAVTYDGTNIKMYSNGDLDGTVNAGSVGSYPPLGSYDGKLYIGATNRFSGTQTTEAHLIGKVGPIQIYSKVLTQAEITQNYNALKGRFS